MENPGTIALWQIIWYSLTVKMCSFFTSYQMYCSNIKQRLSTDFVYNFQDPYYLYINFITHIPLLQMEYIWYITIYIWLFHRVCLTKYRMINLGVWSTNKNWTMTLYLLHIQCSYTYICNNTCICKNHIVVTLLTFGNKYAMEMMCQNICWFIPLDEPQ